MGSGSGEMMTVGELQAQMDGNTDAKAPLNVDRVEKIRKQLVEQSLTDTDMVVNTMRGWLGEKA